MLCQKMVFTPSKALSLRPVRRTAREQSPAKPTGSCNPNVKKKRQEEEMAKKHESQTAFCLFYIVHTVCLVWLTVEVVYHLDEFYEAYSCFLISKMKRQLVSTLYDFLSHINPCSFVLSVNVSSLTLWWSVATCRNSIAGVLMLGVPVLLHGAGADWIVAVCSHFSVAVDDTWNHQPHGDQPSLSQCAAVILAWVQIMNLLFLSYKRLFKKKSVWISDPFIIIVCFY